MSKKINFLRAGALTMVLALGTTCFMSGTLAKYVTSGEGSDSARVAKFGVAVTANGETFAKEYAKTDTSFTLAANTVVSAEDDDVVAPGTKGNMSAITITGQPEVAVEVKYVVDTFELGDNWVDKDNNYYCPLQIKIGDTTLDGTTYDSVDEFEDAVKTTIQGFTAQYEANTDLSGTTVAVPSVSWEWPFSISDANDIKDTYLGDQAAAGKAATVELGMTVSVTQID
jgi:hypothetical protein